MPNHEEHCEDTLKRYGKTFSELHTWMDEPSTILGPNHRKYRHDPNTTPLEAKKIFGENADHACLDHIRLDELESRRKGIGRTSIGIGRTPIGKAKSSQIPIPFVFGSISLMFFFLAIVLVSDPFARWTSIPLFIFSFLLFLCFLGSLTQSKKSVITDYSYTVEMPKVEIKRLNTCSKCGTKYDCELDKCPNCGQE
jgi:hypothetical protein